MQAAVLGGSKLKHKDGLFKTRPWSWRSHGHSPACQGAQLSLCVRETVAAMQPGVSRPCVGNVVALLQEIPKWGDLSGFVYHNHFLLSAAGSDCGFLIPRPWMSAMRDQIFRPYWAGCVINNMIFISAHFLGSK